MHVGVVTNPNSRKNRGRPGRAAALAAVLGDAGEVVETATLDEIRPALRRFLRAGARVWVSDGGDGALHWMLRAGLDVLDEPEFAGRELPLVLPTNGGTIDFVAKTAGIRGNAEQLLARLRRATTGGDVDVVTLDSLHVEGVRRTPDGDRPFRSIGFAAAAGGIGQRFFARYYESDDPRPADIVRVVATAVASAPFSLTPLARLPILPPVLRDYARELFRPTPARLTVDGVPCPENELAAIHVAAIPIDLGGVMRFFGEAAAPGRLHAIYGTPAPPTIIRNLPRMLLGRQMRGRGIVDGPCGEMRVEATTELLAPVVDGEYYHDVVRIEFRLGPPVRFARLPAGRLG